MAFWRARLSDPGLPKHDQGSGSFDDYGYDLAAKNARVTIRLAASDPCQEELRGVLEQGAAEATTAISARGMAEERVDAPIPVRLFLGTRVSGVVGAVPRGLESVVDENLRRIEDRGDKPRIPVSIVETRHGIRVDLLMGAVR
ncbi:hypothetical protein [Homoserinibacter sp. YIM 151385]|uniref:hypothetical protein n=1 Tax=Homoserinibacter sp. YIM 151385 TaxID=2985506 RepID=UPI0022EFE134|nr:hypothetical protein [Homoserinibacter sp. YIM 151385]WBU38403.1 hypothetical protein OF852_02120 [Homoserinibacter sp. YIM 151385]